MLTLAVYLLAALGWTLASVYCLPTLLKAALRKTDSKRRRHPLARERRLRTPGYTLAHQSDVVRIKILGLAFGLVIALLSMCSLFFESWVAQPQMPQLIRVLFCGIGLGAVWFLLMRRMRMRWVELSNLQLGLDGELATAEGLAPLLARGYQVFHDVPFDGFNIDHVAIGPNGVFSIETKMRRKDRENEGHKLRYDGARLHFPGGSYSDEALRQARDQARDLGIRLEKATAIPVSPRPVLVFPGWWVDLDKLGDVMVLNSKSIAQVIMQSSGQAVLDVGQIQSIAYAVEQRCRDVENFAT